MVVAPNITPEATVMHRSSEWLSHRLDASEPRTFGDMTMHATSLSALEASTHTDRCTLALRVDRHSDWLEDGKVARAEQSRRAHT